MTTKTERRLRLIRGVLLSLLIPITGVALALACIGIYQSGEAPFTRASVSAALIRLAPLWGSCLALILISGILEWILPAPAGLPKKYRDRRAAVQKLRARVDFSRCTAAARTTVTVCKALDAMLVLTQGVLIAFAAMPSVGYFTTLANFTTQSLNADIVAAALSLIPFCVIALGLCTVADFLREENLIWEQRFLKRCLGAGAARSTRGVEEPSLKGERTVWVLRLVVAALAVALIVAGILNGGMRDVLGKAIKICTECIGLG